jgi:hypothetical protein
MIITLLLATRAGIILKLGVVHFIAFAQPCFVPWLVLSS